MIYIFFKVQKSNPSFLLPKEDIFSIFSYIRFSGLHPRLKAGNTSIFTRRSYL